MNVKKVTKIHPVDLYVGKRLRQKRLECGISQDELAASVDLTFQQIQKYERGINRISSSKLFDFAKFLRVSIQYFFEGLDEYGNAVQSDASDLCDSMELKDKEIMKDLQSLSLMFSKVNDRFVRKNIIDLVQKLATSGG